MMKKIAFAALLLSMNGFITGTTQHKGDECILGSEFIFQTQDVSFPSCHASTLTEISNGLLSAWFGGKEERNRDVGI
jgi:hypothetical protein